MLPFVCNCVNWVANKGTGIIVICGGITIFAFTDMIMFARKKKRAYVPSPLPLPKTPHLKSNSQ